MVERYRLNRIEWIYRAQTFLLFRWFFARVSATTTTLSSDGYSKILSCPSPFSRETEKSSRSSGLPPFLYACRRCRRWRFRAVLAIVAWLASRQLVEKTLSIKCIRLSCCHQSTTITPQKSQAKSVVAYGWSCWYPPYFEAAAVYICIPYL